MQASRHRKHALGRPALPGWITWGGWRGGYMCHDTLCVAGADDRLFLPLGGLGFRQYRAAGGLGGMVPDWWYGIGHSFGGGARLTLIGSTPTLAVLGTCACEVCVKT